MATPHSKGTNNSALLNLIPSTAGVKGIEAAYNRAGATSSHTPGGHGAEGVGNGDDAKMGSQTHRTVTELHGDGNGGMKTIGSHGSEERNEPSFIGHFFNKLLNGSGDAK